VRLPDPWDVVPGGVTVLTLPRWTSVLVRRLATRACATALVLGAAGALPAPAQAAGPTTEKRIPADLPDGVPAAATRPEPKLRTPAGWPFAQRISKTSGTERMHGGASYWTDFVYDDHGAAIPSGFTLDNTAYLAPTQGVYEQPAEAAGNGADVFVAATGADRRARTGASTGRRSRARTCRSPCGPSTPTRTRAPARRSGRPRPG
jgi:hypothetical protein